MESTHSLCNCDNGSAYVGSCCFNPAIYFVCKLCRGAFENVDKLLLHKRQEHTLNELKGIKFIVFEERFAETAGDTFLSPLLSTSVGSRFRCDVDGTKGDKNSDQHLHQVENHDINTIIDIPEVKLPNPYVYVRRLSALEIRSYTRLSGCSGPPQNIQNPEDCNEIIQDNQSDFNSIVQDEEIVRFPEPFIHLEKLIIGKQKSRCSSAKSSESVVGSSPSCSFLTNAVPTPASSINLTTQEEIHILPAKRCKLSNAETIFSNSHPQISSPSQAVIYNVNPTADLQSEIKEHELADGEFIVANVLQSSDGVGKVQFLSASSPVASEASTVDSGVNKNAAAVEHFDNEINFIKHESVYEPAISDDASPVPSPVPSSTDDPNLGAPSDNEAQVSIAIGSPTIRAPSNTNTTASARKLRNRSKINYSENQTCAKCSRDFYTVEELETHEKVCVRNKSKRKTFRKRDVPVLIPVSGCPQATQNDLDAEIQVIQTAAVSPNDLKDEVEVIDSEGDDKDYEGQDVISSDSELEENVGTIGVGTVVVRKRNKELPIPAIYAHCRLSIKEWLKKERATNPENIICLDPDPFQGDGETDDVTDTEATVFVVTPENPLKCKLCLKTLTSDAMAKTHLNYCWINNKRKHFYCPLCRKEFKGKGCMYKHNRRKHPKPGDVPLPNKKRIKCTVCSKEFNTTKTSFKFHMETHEKRNEKNFFCEICGSGFGTKRYLQAHRLTHSQGRPVKCKLCPMAFRRNYYLSLHMAVHVKDKNYHCSTCSKSFVSKNVLKRHAKLHSKDGWFSCHVHDCDFKCPYRTTLVYHCKVNHKEAYLQMAKFPCTDCNEAFVNKRQLEMHAMVHSGEKPFKCSAEGCNRSFRRKHRLDEHLRQHTGERPFQCDKCGSAFSMKSSFDKHMKGHNNPPNPVLCHLCPRKFPHNYELQQHLIFHEKGKQFGCDTCGVKCVTKAGLKGHLKTHAKAKGDVGVDNDSRSKNENDEADTT